MPPIKTLETSLRSVVTLSFIRQEQRGKPWALSLSSAIPSRFILPSAGRTAATTTTTTALALVSSAIVLGWTVHPRQQQHLTYAMGAETDKEGIMDKDAPKRSVSAAAVAAMPQHGDGTKQQPPTRSKSTSFFLRRFRKDSGNQKDDNPTPTTTIPNNNNNKNTRLWKGQVLKRQMHRPAVPYPLWDYNWDGNMTDRTTLAAQSASTAEPVVGTTRHVLLIRHGQYNETHSDDEHRHLTPLGRQQAILTGKRLASMQRGIVGEAKRGRSAAVVTTVHCSGMTRARETAELIVKEMGNGVELSEPDPMLNEALPAPMIPVRPDIDGTEEIDEHRGRIEEAFHKYVYREVPLEDNRNDNPDANDVVKESGINDNKGPAVASTEEEEEQQQQHHRFEVIVCHGNIIRYFFCRALQIPPEAWLRMSIYNCGITYLMIKPNGYVSCRTMGDIGHLDHEHSTFSMSDGFAWS